MKRDYPDRPMVGVGAIVIRQEELLTVKRGNPPLQGEWSVPGGVVELGETLAEAIVREVVEETGIVIAPVKVAEVVDRISRDDRGRPQYHYVLIDYLCEYISGEPRAGDDVSDVRWVKLRELDGLEMAEFTKQVVRRAAAPL